MFYLSSLINSLAARRATPAQGEDRPATLTDSAALTPHHSTRNSSTVFSLQDAQESDAHLDDFVDALQWDLSLIDLACYTETPSSSHVT